MYGPDVSRKNTDAFTWSKSIALNSSKVVITIDHGLIEMKTHIQLIEAMSKRPGVKAEVDRIEREEAVLLDTLLKARYEAGLTQADVAQRMGTLAPAVARLERSLATGKHSPSIATVRKYAKACGKTLILQVA
jgi:DNA-binding XRE family transcriptional regulator